MCVCVFHVIFFNFFDRIIYFYILNNKYYIWNCIPYMGIFFSVKWLLDCGGNNTFLKSIYDIFLSNIRKFIIKKRIG